MARDERRAAIQPIHRKRSVSRVLPGVVAVMVLAAACSSPGAPASAGSVGRSSSAVSGAAVVAPGTPAGSQLRWFLAAKDLPVSDAQLRAHVNPSFLTIVGSAGLNQLLHAGGGAHLISIKATEPSMVTAVIAARDTGPHAWLTLVVDSRGLIDAVYAGMVDAGPVPTSWAGVDAALRSLAPQVRLLVADVTNGSCRPVHGIDPDTPALIGSVFKLYVLHALGTAVAAGTVRWDQPLTITPQVKSLYSALEHEPDGTRISVRDVAAKMISISDGTASDMLIKLVGRSAVEAALTTTGMADPGLDRPFLTSREAVILDLEQWPALSQRYQAADEAGRRTLLADTVDRLPLPDAAARRAVGTHVTAPAWVASARDICRAYTSLAVLARRPGLSPIGQVLSLNDLGLDLDPAQWRTTWHKGGSGPGVATLTYLATTRTGHSYVVTVLLRNPSPVQNPSPPKDANSPNAVLLSAIKAAFTLAAHG